MSVTYAPRYAPRHARSRVRPEALVLVSLIASVLAVVMAALALTQVHAAAVMAPLPSASAAAPAHPAQAAATPQRPAQPREKGTPGVRPVTRHVVVTVVIVRPGATLSMIAQAMYGTASAWPAIYAANRTVIGPDPAVIQPGMRLIMPLLS